MKCLILAGGRGTRLGNLCEQTNKCMLSVNGKRLLEYNLECAAAADISEIVIVVGYQSNQITAVFKDEFQGKKISYVFQKEQHGLVHAIECAQEALGSDDFMLMLGDEFLVHPRHRQMIQEFSRGQLFGMCGVVTVSDMELIRKTYAVIQEQDGRIIRLIEKPLRPWNAMMGTGNCIFKNEIFSYIGQTPINQKRGEKELPDLIQCAIDEGKLVHPFVICEHYVNVNKPEEVEKAESYFSHP